jgi:hypothetical protein
MHDLMMGYRSVIPRTMRPDGGGRSKYSFGKMFRLAMDAIFSFSLIPLYIGMTLGGILLCLAGAQIIYVLSFWLTGRSSDLVAGWSSLMSVTLVIGGMVMILLGFIGVYIGYIFQEVSAGLHTLSRKGKNELTDKPVFQFVFASCGESIGNVESRWQGWLIIHSQRRARTGAFSFLSAGKLR